MTTTTAIHFTQADEREREREDSCWYTFSSSGNDLVAMVTKGKRTIGVYADGEMRIEVYTKNGNDFVQEGTIRYCDDLEEFGVTKDSDLWGLPYSSDAMPDMVGPNANGYYYVVVHNSWFDLYEEVNSEHLDAVCDTLTQAVRTAFAIINDDDDELWGTLSE